MVRAISNPWGYRDPHSYVSWVTRIPKSLNPKQDSDPPSRVCTAKPRDRQTNRLTDAGIIDRNSPHSMQPNNIIF